MLSTCGTLPACGPEAPHHPPGAAAVACRPSSAAKLRVGRGFDVPLLCTPHAFLLMCPAVHPPCCHGLLPAFFLTCPCCAPPSWRAVFLPGEQLTWDADDEGRKKALSRRLTAEEIKEDDLRVGAGGRGGGWGGGSWGGGWGGVLGWGLGWCVGDGVLAPRVLWAWNCVGMVCWGSCGSSLCGPGNCAAWWRVLGEAYLGACSPGCSALWPPYPPPLLLRLLLRCCLWPRPHG